MSESVSGFLEPVRIKVNAIEYIISKFPATVGREIIAKYTTSNIPKVGNYEASESVMLKLMSYVARVTPQGDEMRLSRRELVDNHVPDWETLTKLEWEMMRYNCSFFQNGKALDSLKSLEALAKSKITEILTGLLAKSSPAAKPPCKN